MAKIFLPGATGYLAGDALAALVAAHPEYEITTSVRNAKSEAIVAAAFPNIRIVIADLDQPDTLREEAARADIVLHAAHSDHVPALHAIIDGLYQRHAATGKAGHLIYVTGTGILMWEETLAGRVGAHSDLSYDDWDGLAAVKALPEEALHGDTTHVALRAGEPVDADGKPNIKIALSCPPCIYGPGRGPANATSWQAYYLSREMLKRGRGLMVGEGKARWSTVHVQDLTKLHVLLTEAAAGGVDEVEGESLWLPEGGYYFAENGEVVWGEVSAKVADIAHARGWIPSKEVDSVTIEEADSLAKFGGPGWGMNSRSTAMRARKLLGWQPEGKSLMEELPDIVEGEAKALGLLA